MRRSSSVRHVFLALFVLAPVIVVASRAGGQSTDPAGPNPPSTPRAVCGPGSHPETGAQGRVPKSEVDSGRAGEGYRCNTTQLAHVGESGGYKVERYVDKSGHECAYYDTTLLFPANAGNLSSGDLTGVAVLDMSDPRKPVKTTTLVSPAMQSPHESVVLNQKRGLLAAVTANPVYYPGLVDVYDVSEDCRQPTLLASAPVGVLGHESGFAPDGRTLYVAALHSPVVAAVDLSNPSVPTLLGTYGYYSHGINLSDDGNTLYMASRSGELSDVTEGLAIFDTSEIQARKLNPQMKLLSNITWDSVSTPQINLPVTIDGHPYLIEMDEFGGGDGPVGAARVIDIADDTKPRVISNIRLEVNQAAAHRGPQTDDYGTASLQDYTGHYCNVPRRIDPGIVACTFILSGLRVFDIRDPHHPKEIAYFNGPISADQQSAWAMSSPAFDPESGDIWYSDGNSGFYSVRVTNGVWPFSKTSGPSKKAVPSTTSAPQAVGDPAADEPPQPAVRAADEGRGGALPISGGGLAVLAAVGLSAVALGLGARRLSKRP